MIPGLENAQFVRYGVMHRNSFLNSPKLLNADFSFRERIIFSLPVRLPVLRDIWKVRQAALLQE